MKRNKGVVCKKTNDTGKTPIFITNIGKKYNLVIFLKNSATSKLNKNKKSMLKARWKCKKQSEMGPFAAIGVVEAKGKDNIGYFYWNNGEIWSSKGANKIRDVRIFEGMNIWGENGDLVKVGMCKEGGLWRLGLG